MQSTVENTKVQHFEGINRPNILCRSPFLMVLNLCFEVDNFPHRHSLRLNAHLFAIGSMNVECHNEIRITVLKLYMQRLDTDRQSKVAERPLYNELWRPAQSFCKSCPNRTTIGSLVSRNYCDSNWCSGYPLTSYARYRSKLC